MTTSAVIVKSLGKISLKMNKESLGLEVFQDSELKRKMLKGELAKGEQIWIYHDAETNPNLVARINRYSHVVVYVGCREDKNGKRVLDRNGEEIHDVVHVAKSNWRGIVVAGITRVDINTVVKPNDKVFLGHKLKKCQFAGNVRQKIAERAIACAEKPKLLFAYDHRFEPRTNLNFLFSLSLSLPGRTARLSAT